MQQSRQVAECVQAVQQGSRLTNEEDLFYASINAPITPAVALSAITTGNRLYLTCGETTRQPTPLLAITAPNPAPVNTTNVFTQDRGTDESRTGDTEQDVTSTARDSPTNEKNDDDETVDDDLSQRTRSQLTIGPESDSEIEILQDETVSSERAEKAIDTGLSCVERDASLHSDVLLGTVEKSVTRKRKLSDDDSVTPDDDLLGKRKHQGC